MSSIDLEQACREIIEHSTTLREGVAAGTAAVMTEGTELCHKEDVERLYPRVRKQEATG